MGLLLLALLAATACAKHLSGSISTKSPSTWQYLGRFTYLDDGKGSLEFAMWADETYTPVNPTLLFYHDESDHWPEVYEKPEKYTCIEKSLFSTDKLQYLKNGQLYNIAVGEFVRPRTWWVVFTDCNATSVSLSYKMTFLNSGNHWDAHYSADMMGLPQLHVTMLLLFSLVCGYHIMGLAVWWQRVGKFHTLVRLISVVLLLQWVSILVFLSYYAQFSEVGQGKHSDEAFATFTEIGAQVVFIVLLLLLGKGWTITTSNLPDRRFMLFVLVAFIAMYLGLFGWEYSSLDPATMNYVYESGPGVVLLMFRVIVLVFLLASVHMTHKVERIREKKMFYKKMAFVSTIWFLLIPFAVIFASALDPWVRFIAVESMYLVVSLVCYSIFVYLLYPSRAEVYFTMTSEQPTDAPGDAYTAMDL